MIYCNRFVIGKSIEMIVELKTRVISRLNFLDKHLGMSLIGQNC